MDNEANSLKDAKLDKYDQRSGPSIKIVEPCGVGKNQPVGMIGNPKVAYAVPCGRVKTMRTDEKA